MIINTCIWFQWLSERHKRAPPAGRRAVASTLMQRETARRAEEEKYPRRRERTGSIYVLFWCLFLLLNADLWLVTLDFLVLLPWTPNLATLVPKPGTRKPACRHATRQPHPTCGASPVARWSSSGAAPSALGHEAGAGRSVPALGPGAGWRPAGHPELARPGGNPRRSPIDRPRPADEDGTPRRPGGLRGPIWEDSGGVWLGAHPVAGGSPTAACREPPGLRRPKAGHPATRRPKPRAAPSTLPLRGTRGLRLTVCDGSAAPGCLPQVAHGRAPRRRGSDRPGGAGAVRRPTTPANGRVGPVPTSLAQAIQLAEDHMAACPGVGEPRPHLSLSLPPALPSPSLSRPVPAPRSRLQGAPRAPPRSGNGQAERYPRRGGGARARNLSTVLSPAIPCPSFCRWGGGKAWAGLLEMRGSGALPGPLSHDGGGIAGPGPRLPGGCPRSSRAVPDTCEYQGGVHIRPWWIRAVTKPPSIKAWYSRGRWIRAARLRWGVCTVMWRITP